MPNLNFSEYIGALKPYIPGVPIEKVAQQLGVPCDSIIKLASNENPLGASPKALEALATTANDLARYPDSDSTSLTHALAVRYSVPQDWILVGAGSGDVMSVVATALLAPDRSAVFSQYSFQAIAHAVQRCGATALVVPAVDYGVDLEGLLERIRLDTGLIYIANPGNPTGTLLEPSALRAFVEKVPPHIGILIDEAYYEYVPADIRGDAVQLVHEHENVIVTRTFSKAYGLAGLRVGYGIAQRSFTEVLKRIRAAFSVTQAAQIATIAALEDEEFLNRSVSVNEEARKLLTSGLEQLGLRYIPSYTNFLLVMVGAGSLVASKLQRLGIIVRPVDNYGLKEWIRISIGRPDEIRDLLKALPSALGEGPLASRRVA